MTRIIHLVIISPKRDFGQLLPIMDSMSAGRKREAQLKASHAKLVADE